MASLVIIILSAVIYQRIHEVIGPYFMLSSCVHSFEFFTKSVYKPTDNVTSVILQSAFPVRPCPVLYCLVQHFQLPI